MARVVADDERDLAVAARVLASSRTRCAMYMPDTAVLGTVHDADTPQLPQSISPVEESVRHAGWVCGSVAVGLMFDAIFRAPSPP